MTGFLINTNEQSARDMVFVQPRAGANLILNNMTVGKAAPFLDGFNQINDTSNTANYCTANFRFRGRRIGILLGLYSGYGVLAFDVDGVDYGTYDCGKNAPSTGVYNVPYIIATDLPEGEHILTITKVGNGTFSSSFSIQGFLVEDSSNVQTFMRTGYNFHDMLDGNLASPKNIGTTDTTINSVDTWVHTMVFTNTTASPITVTLKNNAGSVVIGPFSVPANDIKQISGPIFFKTSFKALASATGVFVTVGGQ